jgi:N6-adenosine-specific RNA methylase IME4
VRTSQSELLVELSGIGAGAILADPPWHFQTYSAKGQGKSPSQHYATLTPDAIAELPVDRLAAPDCWLFLWIPSSQLPIGLKVMERWGFAFSGRAFVWIKSNRKSPGFCVGMGKTTRKNAEDCWLAKRGTPRVQAHDVRELIVAPRREHSRKPDEQYGRIERLCAGPYVELFARQRWPGWHSWGDEADLFAAPSVELPFDAEADVWASVLEAYGCIRRRKAAGGPGWVAGGDYNKIISMRGGEQLVVYRDGRIEHHRNGQTQWVETDYVRTYWPESLPELERVLAELP